MLYHTVLYVLYVMWAIWNIMEEIIKLDIFSDKVGLST